ncbi:DUF6596 domain-containing protein [Micromonospora sediminicola]|uniref:RNA polymerase sigma factor n=1 Tax=Micromonospora sediminicola TaxID=946078 RepID=UPI003402D1C2
MTGSEVESLLRGLAPQVLAAVVRRYGHFTEAEDAVQEALLAAALQWPVEGVPNNPRGWLVTVAARRLTDLLRQEQARQRREQLAAHWALREDLVAAPADHEIGVYDDTLVLLFMCCHPALSPASQIALTLRAVGGLTTAEIARAFLVPTASMTRRISRAKQRIREGGARFSLPGAAERAERLAAVLHVLYLMFNEGYSSTSGIHLQRSELSGEAIRLARLVHRAFPDDGETVGLLALMLLTDARRRARTDAHGALIPMAEQDRTLWDSQCIAEGTKLLTDRLGKTRLGPYQIQAAIAAVHDEASSMEQTDWAQIVALYELLMSVSPNPMVALNHAVAVSRLRGPQCGLELLARLETDPRMADDHRLHSVRGHLLEEAGAPEAARAAYRAAAGRTTSLPQQRYLHRRAAGVSDGSTH